MPDLTPDQQLIADTRRRINTHRIAATVAVPAVNDLIIWLSHLIDAADPTRSQFGPASPSAEQPLPYEPQLWARSHLEAAMASIRTVTNDIQTALKLPPDQRAATESHRKCPACGRRRPVRIRASQDGPGLDGRITESQTMRITTLAEQVYGSLAAMEKQLGTEIARLDRKAAKRLIRSLKG